MTDSRGVPALRWPSQVEGTERDPDWLAGVESQVKKNQEASAAALRKLHSAS